ncbi:DUF2339 domain-containing protein [Caldalkalibacillus mannanilyticus]|uniref:DUF2339 domain-containing protein n=1 Tax=Caldalkalibacillus mannanilyticus TaxID=1418 RepID=UPI00046894C9|nr:DUF2339 domain-containing protein [Caldalkalibacillus mannanilyticus]
MLIFITQLAMYFTEGVAEHIQHLVISFSWALYAIAGVLYGVMRSKKNVRVFGVGLLFFTLLKIIFVDLPNVPLFIRAILFIGLGAIGIFMSRMYYSKKST